ncbi:MAG: nucleotide exchange factor GrpE [Planctomycetaceae bacterium]|jgi:molecular chaperone GrpE|nr:nucleotide exchange factor GrpE [Planctomycetaceae bacterium]
MSEEHIDLVSEPDGAAGGKPDTNTGGGSAGELEQLRIDLEEAKNRGLRALADLENFRTRTNRQAAEERKYANLDLMRELLPIWDNIGRALQAVEKSHSLETLTEGVQIVHQQFIDVLQKYHCEKIDAQFKPFDPNFHASIAQMPNAEYPANTVVEEVQSGFKLYDRVVRPSQVVLSK